MSEPIDGLESLDPFLDQGLISDVLFLVKAGKEAVVYCCRAGAAGPPLGAGRDLLAAKVYRRLDRRSFRHDAAYHEGGVSRRLVGRNRRAFEKKSEHGRAVQFACWTAGEWETLRVLRGAGADVPEPLARSEGALLMEYLGAEEGPAPALYRTRLDLDEAVRLYAQLLANVELFLARDLVHADLSAHNVLVWEGKAWVIDFPQAVDARFNPQARELLLRDLANLDTWFGRVGVAVRGAAFGEELWERFMLGEL